MEVGDEAQGYVSTIPIASGLPRSSIVHDEELDVMVQAQMLFRKYVAVGAEYEINISYQLRSELAQRFRTTRTSVIKSLGVAGDNDMAQREGPDIALAFDGCCEVMMKLLNHSLARFKLKPEYLKMINFDNGLE